MTLAESLGVALAAYDEDEAEREAILGELAPVVLDGGMFAYAIGMAWGAHADEICAAIARYQLQRADVDRRMDAMDARAVARIASLDVARARVTAGEPGPALDLARLVLASSEDS